MSPPEKTEAMLEALVATIRLDIAAARARIAECASEHASNADAPPRAALAFMALSVDRAYSAVEAALLRIARSVDEVVPAGDAWHAALVHQMTLPIAERRSAVFTAAVASALEPLRRHRHWLRHAYAAELDWDAMRTVVAAAPAAIHDACEALERFVSSLEQ